MAAAFISLCITALCLVLSLVFKVAGKLRLSLPVLYLLVASVSTLFSPWVNEHETLVYIGLYVILGIVVLSWIISLVKAIKRRRDEKHREEDIAWQIRRAREAGIPLDNVRFDENDCLIDPRTGRPVEY